MLLFPAVTPPHCVDSEDLLACPFPHTWEALAGEGWVSFTALAPEPSGVPGICAKWEGGKMGVREERKMKGKRKTLKEYSLVTGRKKSPSRQNSHKLERGGWGIKDLKGLLRYQECLAM